jgi:type 1 glutamine amidotransferase
MTTANERIALTMLSGSFEYDSEDSLTVLRGYLEENAPAVDATLLVYESEDDNPSLELLQEETDVLLVFTRRLNASGVELERFKSYCARGGAVVGLRTASHAYQNWLAFDGEVLGGNYDGHYGSGITTHVELAENASEHPILHEVLPFESRGSLYRNTPISESATLLLSGRTEEHFEPVAWTHHYGGGRVFYTSLGHQKDFWELDFLRLIENAVLWAASKSP